MFQTLLPIVQSNQILQKRQSQASIQAKRQKSSPIRSMQLDSVATQTSQAQRQQYQKLQELLQARQASIREHIKSYQQLKLYIEDLEDNNKLLRKNNNEILTQYKTQVLSLKRQNQELRSTLKKIEHQNIHIKNKINNKLNTPNQKSAIQQFNHKIQSQTIIKVIESQEMGNSIRQSSASKLPFNLSNKGSPMLLNQTNRSRNSKTQSKQKLRVTMKSTNNFYEAQNDIKVTPGRNQKNIENLELFKVNESERSIKKIIELKKWNKRSNQQQILASKKLLFQKHSKNHKSGSIFLPSQNQIKSQFPEEEQKNVIKKLSKQVGEQITINQGKSAYQKLQINFSTSRKAKNQDLIKLGHYGHANHQTERAKVNKAFS